MTVRTRIVRSTPAVTADGDGHTVTVRLVGWNEPAEVTDNGRDFYTEQFSRSGLRFNGDRLIGENEHNGPPVFAARDLEDRDDGLYATGRISRSNAGRDLVADLEAGIVEHVSVDFDDDPTPVAPGATITRSGAQLRRFAFTLDPQHTGARVVGRRSTTTPDEETPMPDTITDDTTVTDDTTDTEADTSDHQRSSVDQRTAPRPSADPSPPLVRAGGRFRSLGAFVKAAALGEVEGDELARYQRALDPATTADIAGLIHDQWINEIIDLYRAYTPTVEAFAQRPLPEKGDTISQPRVKVRPLVDQRASETEALDPTNGNSRAVEIETVSWDVETFAGGQNMSIRSIRRSEPSYLEEVMRLHLQEMMIAKNTAAVTALEAIDYATNSRKVDKTADYSGGAFVDDVVDAQALLFGGTNRFGDTVLMATNVWVALAKAKDSDGRPLYPSVSPMNPAGSLSLRSASGSVMDLSYRVEPSLTDNHIIVGLREAFRTLSSGTETLTADVPVTLGRDVAVYCFSAMGAADENGLVEISPAA
jgi:HK97 family phage major capsid protein